MKKKRYISVTSYIYNAWMRSFDPRMRQGWTEAMQLMVEGDKWEMYIPSELGCGRILTLTTPALFSKSIVGSMRNTSAYVFLFRDYDIFPMSQMQI